MNIIRWVELLATSVGAANRSKGVTERAKDAIGRSRGVIDRAQQNIQEAHQLRTLVRKVTTFNSKLNSKEVNSTPS